MPYPLTSERKARPGLPNPFRTYSSFVYPRTFKDVLIWASYLWERNPAYRTAVHKVVSYFVSDITVSQTDRQQEVDADVLNSFKDLVTDLYGIMQLIVDVGDELAAMGNVFVSAEHIFSRNLVCPTQGCGWQMALHALRKGRDYDWEDGKFVGKCPRCGRKVTWIVKDVKSQDPDGRKVRFVLRSAEDMELQYNRLTGTYKCLYKMPSDVASGIRRGDAVYLEDTPQVFMDAANVTNPYIEFPEDMFFHMRTRTLSNMDKLYKGWGMPLFMSAFDNVVRRQHLDKFNEAVVLDYLVPTRIISPDAANLKAGIDDPNRMPMSGAQWSGFMKAALRGRITNPTQWIISPVPVRQEQVGGDKSVIPVELLEWETNQMLADMGIPQEFRQTNFQVVAPTMGLRMFERQWIHFPKGLNRFVQWASGIIARAHSFENLRCDLDMTSFVEDDMNKQALIGMMQGGLIAKGPVLQRLGIDYEDDIKMRMKEQQMEEDAAREQQTKGQGGEMLASVLPPAASVGIGQAQANIDMMQQQAQGAAPPVGPGMPEQPMAPAAPAGPGGPAGPMPFNTGASQSASIEQLFQEAQSTAEQLYAAPPNIRKQQLAQMKATNPAMHAQVMQIMRDMAQQVASDAVAQSRQGG